MKMFKWSFLVVVLVVIIGFMANTPCYASDSEYSDDNTVMTDDESAYDSDQYVEPDTTEEEYNNQDEDMYNDSSEQAPDEGYTEESEPQEETN